MLALSLLSLAAVSRSVATVFDQGNVGGRATTPGKCMSQSLTSKTGLRSECREESDAEGVFDANEAQAYYGNDPGFCGDGCRDPRSQYVALAE